jgi:hypothetical protein
MKQYPMSMTISNMVWQTERAKDAYNHYQKLAEAMKTDNDKIARLRSHECISCYYTGKIGGRIGGSAMTHKACMCCGQDQLYSSTNTDALCMTCAQKCDLCKHCGGDVQMRVRRKEWPKSDAQQQKS